MERSRSGSDAPRLSISNYTDLEIKLSATSTATQRIEIKDVASFVKNVQRISFRCVTNDKFLVPDKSNKKSLCADRSLVTNSTYMEIILETSLTTSHNSSNKVDLTFSGAWTATNKTPGEKIAIKTNWGRIWSCTNDGELLCEKKKIPGPHEFYTILCLVAQPQPLTRVSSGSSSGSSSSFPSSPSSGRSSLPNHTYLALRSFHGTFVGLSMNASEDSPDSVNTDSHIVCNAKSISKAELFQPFSQVGFKGSNKKFVHCSLYKDFLANSSRFSTTETFTLEFYEGKCSIITSHNTYITANLDDTITGETIAEPARRSPQEMFSLEKYRITRIKHEKDEKKEKEKFKFALKSCHGKYIRIGPKNRLVADSEGLSEHCLFSFKVPRDSMLKGITRISSPITHFHTPAQTKLIMKDWLSLDRKKGKMMLEKLKLEEEIVALESSESSFSEMTSPLSKSSSLTTSSSSSSSDPLAHIEGSWIIPFEELKLTDHTLGIGYFGKVSEAKWRETSVACKFIYRECFKSKKDIDIFMHELEMLSTLHHPNICQFLGVAFDGKSYCLVTEMLHGSLYDFLRTSFGLLSHNTLLRWQIALNIAQGMCYMHLRKPPLLHRDLSSRNVLLTEISYHAKVADFGLAKAKGEISADTGALLWMAPEVISSSGEKCSEFSDIYSYGIILWEMWSGEEPLSCHLDRSGKDFELKEYVKNVTDGYRPPIPSDCPSNWSSLIQSCWDQKPESRPTFQRVIETLKKFEEFVGRKRSSSQPPVSLGYVDDG